MKEELCTIVEARPITLDTTILKIKSKYISSGAEPGNFVMVSPNDLNDPLLKRPLGILDIKKDCFYLMVENVGKGTKLLQEKKEGEKLCVLGPLGNKFKEIKKQKILLLSGGIGIVPLFFFARKFVSQNETTLIYGARKKSKLLMRDEFDKMDFKKIFYHTDDGSLGRKGYITSSLKDILEKEHFDFSFSCGPNTMFNAIKPLLEKHIKENYFSLEAFMGCGFGVCHSCVVQTRTGYKKVCHDGPIFNTEELI